MEGNEENLGERRTILLSLGVKTESESMSTQEKRPRTKEVLHRKLQSLVEESFKFPILSASST